MDPKRQVGIAAAARVQTGMRVGLGTGSTAHHFIVELARRHVQEGLRIICVPSSFSTAILAHELGLPQLPLDQAIEVDLYADGADEVDPQKRLIKGRGAAMVREKLLVHMCQRFLVLVDSSKMVDRLGTRFPVPVEVLPFAWMPVKKALLDLGAEEVTLREATGKDGPVVTDQGGFVLDARCKNTMDVAGLSEAITKIPGVVGHGLFCEYVARTEIYIAGENGLQHRV